MVSPVSTGNVGIKMGGGTKGGRIGGRGEVRGEAQAVDRDDAVREWNILVKLPM